MPDRCTILGERNPHPRDERIVFVDADHKYFLDGVQIPLSVTGLWNQYFDHFDAEGAVAKYFDSWSRDPNSKYHQLIKYLNLVLKIPAEQQPREIIRLWNAGGMDAADSGTHMHAQIEYFLNDVEVEDDTVEFQQFLKWRGEFMVERELRPYRTEWSIFDEEAKIAGQIDSLWVDKDGKFVMVDWKRCNPNPRKPGGALQRLGPHMDCFKNEKGLGPCSDLPNTSFYHYCIQQNVYKYIVDTFYGIVIDSMFLAQFHPDLPEPHCVEVPNMQDRVKVIMDDRYEEMKTGVKKPKVAEGGFF